METCRLYLITPPKIDLAAFAGSFAAVMEAGEVAAVQLRLKGAGDDEVRRAADTLRPVVQSRDAVLIVNDRPDLAAETGCDGVHVGQEDVPYGEARRVVGDEAIVGVSCHNSRHLAMEAAEQGADYVAFGAFFATATKAAKSRAELETLEIWSETTIVPSVAIGGITADNCPPLIEAGADFLAVASGVWNHPEGPAAAVRAFGQAIERAGG